jgi:hypothetical protein
LGDFRRSHLCFSLPGRIDCNQSSAILKKRSALPRALLLQNMDPDPLLTLLILQLQETAQWDLHVVMISFHSSDFGPNQDFLPGRQGRRIKRPAYVSAQQKTSGGKTLSGIRFVKMAVWDFFAPRLISSRDFCLGGERHTGNAHKYISF